MKLVVKDLEFSYPGVPVLRDISFEFRPGETVSIVGENGAGKSTLLKCMNRILSYKQGTVMVEGNDITDMKRKEIALYMAYLPQKTSYLYPITVFDAVLTGRFRHLSMETGRTSEGIVWDILDMMGLEHIAMRDFNEISGGQQQQVIIARALAQEADILLLDEPTAGLDIRHQLEVMDVIQHSVREKDLLAAITLHDLNLAARYSDRVIMLHQGRIFAAGEPLAVFTPEHISAVYGVKASVSHANGSPVIIPHSTADAADEQNCGEAEAEA